MNDLEKMAEYNKRHKKGMGWFQAMKYNVDGSNIIPNPGDLKAIDRFNNSVQGETSSSAEGTTSGEGLGEDLSSPRDLSVGSNVEFFAPGKGLIRGTIIDIIDDLDKEMAVIKGSNNRKYNVDMQELRDQMDFDNFNEDWYKETGYDLSRNLLIAKIKKEYNKNYNFDKYTDKLLFNIYNRLRKQHMLKDTDISKEENEYINDPKYNFDDERDDEYIVESNSSNDYILLRSAVEDVLDYFIDMECYTINPNEWLGCDSWQEVKESVSLGLMEIYECAQGLLEILNKELKFYHKNPVGKHISEYSPDVEIIEDLDNSLQYAMKKYSNDGTVNKRNTIEIESLNDNSITDRLLQLADIINSVIEFDDFEIYPLYNNIRIKFIIKHYINELQKVKEILYSMQNIVRNIEKYNRYISSDDYSLIINFYIPRDFKLKHTHEKVEIECLNEESYDSFQPSAFDTKLNDLRERLPDCEVWPYFDHVSITLTMPIQLNNRTIAEVREELNFYKKKFADKISENVDSIKDIRGKIIQGANQLVLIAELPRNFELLDGRKKIEVESLDEDYPIDKRHYNLIVDRCIYRDYTEEEVSEVIDKYNKLFNNTDWFNAVTSSEFLTLMFYEYRSMNSNRYGDFYDNHVRTIVDKYSKHNKIEIENFEYDGDIL